MRELLLEWVEKAEADYATALRELSVNESPNYDAVCFHAQQCVEKLMKAVLIQKACVPPKTHDLAFLNTLAPEAVVSASDFDLRFLSRAAVEYRYPGERASREDAVRAAAICRELRSLLLKQLA